ncbi:putative dihydrolipoyllysine-residue (2-methylpropanoyl)transferase [Microsporum canis]|uniref:Dihydrolipoamide acetyltransferase component of pyruvate dehydrogenase complex n=1 Tax=Arthroderma otae (strain ATCC MYA-4605 / CBS 113480) TaxID=554155 RepID=C5FU85_ARTOC|nr:catalytic domain of components of various dehydrogenase complexes [Microsporum canis CBS 113480]EEQ33469.1 catalytic domain of components of various dehydrogenase complexes [Microsporum canis CBS 113480]
MSTVRSLVHRASLSRGLLSSPPVCLPATYTSRFRRRFHSSPVPWGIRSQILKDVGEGITEVQVIQWYVEEGARIEEWKPLCQYQSDKAIDDITSRYEGVIKKLHFQPDDTVPTGMALCDIEVDDAKYPDSAPAPTPAPEAAAPAAETTSADVAAETSAAQVSETVEAPPKGKYATFATPAVRGMLKQHNIDISLINGTGAHGRVLKEDVQRYLEGGQTQTPVAGTSTAPASIPGLNTPQVETNQSLTPIQSQMFKTMTKSLTIPHFLYSDELNIAALSRMRSQLNATAPKDGSQPKLSYLPFIIKAVSLALNQFPILNARVDTTSNPAKPSLVMRASHNIGVAMDTPTGLLVPNIKNVQARSILDIAMELARLGEVARAGKLTPADLSGGTITVSNIGTIGGTVVAPVLVPTEVAILGIGKLRKVPVFDAEGKVAAGEMMNFSWSADHRVIDGATMARMAALVGRMVESPDAMMLNMR